MRIKIEDDDTTTVTIRNEDTLTDVLDSCPYYTFVLPVTILTKDDNHANVMLLHSGYETIEHFEPHGPSNEFWQKYPLMYVEIKRCPTTAAGMAVHFTDNVLPENHHGATRFGSPPAVR